MQPEHYSPFFCGHSGIYKQETGKLPHWTQTDKLQFITFRLFDSLPQSKIDELRREKTIFENRYPKPWDISTQRLFWHTIGKISSRYLDEGYGSCMLGNPNVRKVVEQTLANGGGQSYEIVAYVIMPNHVHLLIYHFDQSIDSIVQGIKSISSRRINSLLHRKGKVWMPNYFDRIIRNQSHLHSTIKYIEANPRHLNPGSYTLYINYQILQQLS